MHRLTHAWSDAKKLMWVRESDSGNYTKKQNFSKLYIGKKFFKSLSFFDYLVEAFTPIWR